MDLIRNHGTHVTSTRKQKNFGVNVFDMKGTEFFYIYLGVKKFTFDLKEKFRERERLCNVCCCILTKYLSLYSTSSSA